MLACTSPEFEYAARNQEDSDHAFSQNQGCAESKYQDGVCNQDKDGTGQQSHRRIGCQDKNSICEFGIQVSDCWQKSAA